MYQDKILNAYKQAQNYVQDKQIAHDLGITPQKICKIRSGERYLTETEALFLAERIGLSEEEVLVYLAADRSKNHKAQMAWQNIAKKFNGLNMSGISMACGGLALWMMPTQDALANCVLCTLC
jgi:plasmid maintenance system antidote protein VapI